MAYTIVKTDGTVLTTIDDGTVNTTSSPLALPGRNYPGYGQVVDTNFVRSLENFAFTSPPANALRGQTWFNTVDSTLRICPIDGESNANAWFTILTEETLGNVSFTNLNIPGNIVANNITANSNLLSNNIVAQTFSGNVSANFFNTTLTGNTVSNNLYTTDISAGFTTSQGNLTGIWTINGTSGGAGASALILNTGGIAISNVGNLYGIKTDKYMWANGEPVNFGGSYSNAQVANYLPTYIGNVGAPNGATTFNGTTLSAGGPLANGTITGNWTLSTGSKINGLSDIDGANITGTVANANFAAYAGNITLSTQANITTLGVLTALNVNGTATASRFASNIATGTAPFIVFSSTRVANLNADYLDGYHASILPTADTVAARDSSGNLYANYFVGDGSQLTNIPAGNITGDATQISSGSSNVKITAPGGPVQISIAGTPNVTYIDSAGVSIVGTLTVGGNVNLNGTRTNLGSVSNVRILGGSPGFVLSTDGSGGLSWVTAGSATTAQYVTMPNQSNITSVGTLTGLGVNGNLTAVNITANTGIFTGNGSGLTSLSGPNVVGKVANAVFADTVNFASNAAFATSAGAATSAGFVTQASQPGITSVGTLTALNVSGNIQAGGRITGAFFGSGAGLTNIPAGNLSGAVPVAAYANTAGSASTAISATTASNAAFANNAAFATNAGYATNAGSVATASYATSAGSANTANTAAYATTAGTVASIPSGTRMIFAQTSAPTGWTKLTSNDNAALRVVSGAASSGGTVNFTSAFTSQSVSGTTSSTSLSEAQIPSHAHLVSKNVKVNSGSVAPYGPTTYLARETDIGGDTEYNLQATYSAPDSLLSSSVGSGAGHNHTFSGSLNLAVKYVDVIIAQKD